MTRAIIPPEGELAIDFLDPIEAGISLLPGVNFNVRVAATSRPSAATLTGAGVGAFYTSNSNGPLIVGGIHLDLNDRFLLAINGGPHIAYAGIWVATDIGSASTPAVWTRADDFDEVVIEKVWPSNTVTVDEGVYRNTTFSTVFSSNVSPESGRQLDVDLNIQFFNAATDCVGRGSIRLARNPDNSSTEGIISASTIRAYDLLQAQAAEINALTLTNSTTPIADPTGGASPDDESRTAIVAILAFLRTLNPTI